MTKEQEDIIRFLNSLDRDTHNRISVSRNNYTLQIDETEFIRQLNYLERQKMLTIHFITGHHDNLKYYIDIDLEPTLIDYFAIKKSNIRKNIKHYSWELLKFAIPTAISVIALLKSFEII